jgi:class 3 adenylate cyclase/tetratricopeptide (TPR) repeat protein
MAAFPEWLAQVRLGPCRTRRRAHRTDFKRAAHLNSDESRRGLEAGDRRRLAQTNASPGQRAAASSANRAATPTATSGRTMTSRGERRQHLTVMFCDLVGYTGLSQRLDPEELRDVRQSFITACSERVKHYDGYIAQDPGDALVVYFGWPWAHEDDAERCVRAALETVQAVKSIRTIEPLAAHIGIATGEVVVGGAPGAAGGDAGLAYGVAPNLAARLQGVAKANEVLIAHATRSLVGNVFELTDLGSLPLTGLGPSHVWRVEGVRRVAGRFDAVHGGAPLSPLVGRVEEVTRLLHDWHLTRGGSGRAVVIGGEAGIGKSRLTEVLRERIADQSHTTLRYQCSRVHEDVPLHPVIAQIELAAGFDRDDSPAQKLDKLQEMMVGSVTDDPESAALLAALLSLPTDRYPPLGLSAEKRREKTLDTLLGQAEALSRIQPVLMIIEDAHWIDPTSQQLLDALVPRVATQRIMIMITYRTQQAHEYTPVWLQSPHVTALTLTGLAHTQGAELAGNVARGKALPADVLEQIVVRADGLPLWIEELTKMVLESPHLLEEADRFTMLEPMPNLTIPRTLDALLIERMGRREGVSRLAQIGAFLGRTFSYQLLAAVAAETVEEFDTELEELTRTELVFRQGTPPHATYTFKHALVQEAAYNSLPLQRRRRLHKQIADLLEKEFPALIASEPELLAHHRTDAGDPDDLLAAIPLWRQAGESALARVAFQEAVNYLEKGLAIVDRLPPSDERDSLELSLREPLHSAHLRWRGWAALEVGMNATAILWLAQRQRQPQSLLIGLWGMWINTITQGRIAETPTWARRLLVEGNQSGNIDLQIFAHRALLSSHFHLGELQEALDERDKALALYDPRHAARWMELTGNDTRTALGIFASQALWMLGYPDQAAQLSDQKDADSRQLGQPFDVGWALTWGAYVFDYRREPDRLLARFDEADRIGREQSIPLLTRALVPIVDGLAQLRLGHLREAKSSLRAGIDGWKSTGGHLNLPYLKSALGEALALDGDLEGGLRLLDDSLEQIERPGWRERVWLAETLRLKGWVLMRQGKRIEAEAQLRASLEWARRQRARSWELRSSITLAELLIDGGRRDAARELLTPVYAWFTEGLETHDLKAARALLEDLH